MAHTAQIQNVRPALARIRPAASEIVSTERMSLKDGMVFFRDSTPLPASVHIREGISVEWELANLPGSELEKTLQGTDWQWSYYVPSLVGTAWGLTRDQAVHRSVRRLLGTVQEKGLNSVEIASTAVRSVFGLQQATVKLDLRNLQQGPFLREPDPRHRLPRTSRSRHLSEVANRKGVQMKAM